MIKISRKQDCSGCYACSNVCPESAITMTEDAEGFLYPQVDDAKCTQCGLCEKVCPILNHKERVNDTDFYACINKNDDIRLKSSSGGVFSLLAESVIASGGVVFGALFDNDFVLVHGYTDTLEGLSDFRGAKYLQSQIGDAFCQAKEFLEKGRKVLFSGTPCQVSGLLSFLEKEYDNLMCVDMICHGVPSPKVFKMYKGELEKINGATTKKIVFRNKGTGWKQYSVQLSFHNDTMYSARVSEDIFMRGFLANLYLRPSCYDCREKTLNRKSDMTIADFWGVENIAPELDDDKGTSLLLVHSDKGKKILAALENGLIIKKIDGEKAILYNSSATMSAAYNPHRDGFFRRLNASPVDVRKLIIKYTKASLTKRVGGKMRAVLAKAKKKS